MGGETGKWSCTHAFDWRAGFAANCCNARGNQSPADARGQFADRHEAPLTRGAVKVLGKSAIFGKTEQPGARSGVIVKTPLRFPAMR
jgi:hypothetical protein